MRPSREERFWAKVDRTNEGDCWVWTASYNNHGYGQFRDKKPKLAHRVSWELTNGPIPEGLIVRHTCDNPLCVNPSHLLLGTMQDNSDDMVARNRNHKGEARWNCYISEEVVQQIRNLYVKHSRTFGGPALAEQFGIHQGRVTDIASGRRRKGG